MDLIYGRDSSDIEDNDQVMELPLYIPDGSGIRPHEAEKSEDQVVPEVKEPLEEKKVEEAQEDIDEWIKQRKANWMKKISNNRPKEDLNKVIKPTIRQNNRKKPLKQDIQKVKETKFNLNKKMVQRDLELSQNKQIIDFIKVLFDTKTVKFNPES